MFSDNKTINILTALLMRHGIRHAVTCPGSRNAPICHNLNEAGIACHPVTDERSAAFFGIGLCQATGGPVAVCVTSGSAILDTAPAVAEAYYQRVPLIVIAADRPSAWIGQLDGQTMPQTGALGGMARKAVCLPEGDTAEDLWHAGRLVNEALMAATGRARGPVLINVPIREPLYEFHTERLPDVRVCRAVEDEGEGAMRRVAELMGRARRPLIVIGQAQVSARAEGWPTLFEPLSGAGAPKVNEAAHILRHSRLAKVDDYRPDKILYIGGHIVSKEMKQFLRSCGEAETVLISDDGELHDVFQNTTLVGRCDADGLLRALSHTRCAADAPFAEKWATLLSRAEETCGHKTPIFSQLQVIQTLMDTKPQATLHFANSSAVRLGCLASRERFWCNRGINGIDGSVSTAAGHSAGLTKSLCLCVSGDLSFFYDQNALWNNEVDSRLRILLLNNGGGGIFSRFAGLRGSAARERIVMAEHKTTARGICEQNRVEYAEADDIGGVERLLPWLLTGGEKTDTDRPRLLEVFTDKDDDQRALTEYYKHIVTEYDKRVEKD